jgi:hypothetical protein
LTMSIRGRGRDARRSVARNSARHEDVSEYGKNSVT